MKKSLLEERKKITEAYTKRKRQDKIDLELSTRKIILIKQWNKMNFEKEYQNYLKCIKEFKSRFKPNETRFLNKAPNDFSAPGNPLSIEFKYCNYGFKYVGGQYELAEYILQYATSREKNIEETAMYNLISRTPEEQWMLDQYLNSNLEEYRRELERKY